MTISSTHNKATHIADGQNIYAFDFRVDKETDMRVFEGDFEHTVGWSIPAGDLGDPSGGDVVFDTSPAFGALITLVRQLPYTQEVQFDADDPFPAPTQEAISDRLTMMVQQLQEEIERSIQAPLGGDPNVSYVLPDYEASKGLVWSDSEKKLVNGYAASAFYGIDQVNKWEKQQYYDSTSQIGGGSFEIDFDSMPLVWCILGGNQTITFTNNEWGKKITVVIYQTASYTITWPSEVVWLNAGDGDAPATGFKLVELFHADNASGTVFGRVWGSHTP